MAAAPLLPAQVQILIPDVGHIAGEAVHRFAAPGSGPPERARGSEAVVEEHLVEPGMFQRTRLRGLQRRERQARNERQ